jgi:hypothetical protein
VSKESSYAHYLLQRGREEGQRQMARLVLEGRFGSLTADLLAALNTADTSILKELVAHVSTDSLEQVRQRLGIS